MRTAACIVAICSAGCCVAPPVTSKFFDRRSPLGTFKGFVYAIDTREWDYAYESLDTSSREEIGHPLRFEAGIRFGKDPKFRLPIIDIISEAAWDYVWIEGDSRITVYPTVRRDGERFDFEAVLYFVQEYDEWRFDFLKTAEAMYQAMQKVRGPVPENLTRG